MREVDAPEMRARFEKFQCSRVPVLVNADDAALKISFRLKIRQENFLRGKHAGMDGHQSAVNAHVDGLGIFEKRFVVQ